MILIIHAAWVARKEKNPDEELERWVASAKNTLRWREGCRAVFFSSLFPHSPVDMDRQIEQSFQLLRNLPHSKLIFECAGEAMKKDVH